MVYLNDFIFQGSEVSNWCNIFDDLRVFWIRERASKNIGSWNFYVAHVWLYSGYTTCHKWKSRSFFFLLLLTQTYHVTENKINL